MPKSDWDNPWGPEYYSDQNAKKRTHIENIALLLYSAYKSPNKESRKVNPAIRRGNGDRSRPSD